MLGIMVNERDSCVAVTQRLAANSLPKPRR